MAFLALASQKSLLGLQKNFLQLQITSIQNQANTATAQMSAIQKANSGKEGWDCEDDPQYVYYEQLDEELQSEQDLLESQLTAIDNQLSSLKTLVNNSIKSSCTLNLASGG